MQISRAGQRAPVFDLSSDTQEVVAVVVRMVPWHVAEDASGNHGDMLLPDLRVLQLLASQRSVGPRFATTDAEALFVLVGPSGMMYLQSDALSYPERLAQTL